MYLLICALQKNDFPVFGRVWNVDEELRLLDAIEECGIGNWYVIAGVGGSITGAHLTRT